MAADVSLRKRNLPLSDRMMEVIADRFRALGEPLRLRILQVLEQGESSAGEITGRVGANQSNVSRHLQTLHDAGLVERRREGSNVLYSIADPTVLKICRLVCERAEEDARMELSALTGMRSRQR